MRFLPQACRGLADQIEKGALHSPETASLVQQYVAPLLAHGADTLVLGCTHYPFVLPLIEQTIAAAGKAVGVIDTGAAVARQLQRLLTHHAVAAHPAHRSASVTACTASSRL